MEGTRHDELGDGRTAALASLDRALAAASSREQVLDELRARVPGLLPGLRVVLDLQLQDPRSVEVVVLAHPRDDERESYTRPTAGSALARARDLGAERVDGVAAGSRASFPVAFGRSVVATLAVTGAQELGPGCIDTAQVVAAILSGRSFWFGMPDQDDPRSLLTQVVYLRQAAHTLERTDPLTRLPNRVAVFESIAQARSAAQRGEVSSLAFLDLDHYKIVNQAHGHALGDGALVALADRLRAVSARAPISFGRVGGDEFTALASLAPEELGRFLDELADDLQHRPLEVDGTEIHASFSAGVFPIDGHQHSTEEVVSRAESAAYQAKRDGRGRVIVRSASDSAHGESRMEMRQVDVMRSAVRHGRLRIVAQPIRSIRQDVPPPMEAEALVRLLDSHGKTILPDDFVALAEQYDVVNALDRAVLSRVVELLAPSPSPARVSCNVAPHSLLDPAFVAWAGRLVADAGVGDRLVLELTERLPIGRIASVRSAMLAMREAGVTFALDDFGAGTTSYGTLRDLPVEVLKLDGDLTRGVLTSAVDRAMLRSSVEIASVLGLRTIAEGVETQAELDAVAELGVDAVQGYFFGQPMPWPGEVEAGTPAPLG